MVITQNPSSPVHENASNSSVIYHFYDIMSALLSAPQGALMGLLMVLIALFPMLDSKHQLKRKGHTFLLHDYHASYSIKTSTSPLPVQSRIWSKFPQKIIVFFQTFQIVVFYWETDPEQIILYWGQLLPGLENCCKKQKL